MTTALNRRLVGWLICFALLFGALGPLAASGGRAAVERSVAPWDDLCVSAASRSSTRQSAPSPNSPAEHPFHGGAGMCLLCTAGSAPTALPSHPLVFALVPQPGALPTLDLPRGMRHPAVPPGTAQPRAPPTFA